MARRSKRTRVVREARSNHYKNMEFVRALSISGVALGGSDRPLTVECAEELQVSRRLLAPRGAGYDMNMRMSELMGCGDAPRQLASQGPFSAQRYQSYTPRDMRAYNPYPLVGDENMGWGPQLYGSSRGQMQLPYLDPRYGRGESPVYASAQQAMGGRVFGYGDIVGLRVSDLPMGVDANKLYEIFSAYCLVQSANVVDVRDGPQISKHGILQVDDMLQAEAAVLALNGAVLREGHRPIKVELSFGPMYKPLFSLW